MMQNNLKTYVKQSFWVVSLFCMFIVIIAWTNTKDENLRYSKPVNSHKQIINQIPSIRLYDAIVLYSKKYDIPLNYALGIAYTETNYESPYDFDYNHAQSSSAGAVGPMQVMLSTAKYVWNNDTLSTTRLKTDIDFNVETSMKVLKHYKDKHKDWKKTFGAYNTGKPVINNYAIKVFNYKPNIASI